MELPDEVSAAELTAISPEACGRKVSERNPADGTQFVTQLAQFTTLEQDTQSRSDLDQILTGIKNLEASAMSAANPAASNNSTTPSTSAPGGN